MKNKKQEVQKGIFLLVNLRTGVMDGFYSHRSGAQESLDFFEKELKATGWVLTEILGKDQGKINLPNNLFHATAGSIANEKLVLQMYR